MGLLTWVKLSQMLHLMSNKELHEDLVQERLRSLMAAFEMAKDMGVSIRGGDGFFCVGSDLDVEALKKMNKHLLETVRDQRLLISELRGDLPGGDGRREPYSTPYGLSAADVYRWALDLARKQVPFTPANYDGTVEIAVNIHEIIGFTEESVAWFISFKFLRTNPRYNGFSLHGCSASGVGDDALARGVMEEFARAASSAMSGYVSQISLLSESVRNAGKQEGGGDD